MAGPEANRAVLDEMMGVGGKMLFYYVAADEHTVLMGIGVSQERMAAALDVLKQPRKSLAEDADVSVTAAMLPADSQWVAYMSPRGYMQLTQRVDDRGDEEHAGRRGFSLPPFPKCPPVGFAVKATPAELHAEIAVPVGVDPGRRRLCQGHAEDVHESHDGTEPDAGAVMAREKIRMTNVE